MQREIPEGYEKVSHHKHLTLYNSDRGIIISIMERDLTYQKMKDKYPYKVSLSDNQKTGYEGSFQSLSHAEDKVFELARDY